MSIVKNIGDYLHAVKAAVQNKDKIIEALRISAAIKNKVELKHDIEITDEVVAEIMRRKDICRECPFNSDNARKLGIYDSPLPYTNCIHCSCRIGYDNSKEYCASCSCGLSVFNANNPDKAVPLKWGPIVQKK